MSGQRPNAEHLDQATAQRLARLAGVPVDTSRLERRLRAALDRERPGRDAIRFPRRWLPLSSAAAIVLLGLAGWVIFAGGEPAVAAPTDLVRIHQDLVSGAVHRSPVRDIDEANRQIAAQWAQAPVIPRPQSAAIKSCCLHRVQDVQVACVLMEYAGQPVTLVVAQGDELCSAEGDQIVRGGRTFIAHEQNGLQMVMSHHEGRWLCVMGKLAPAQLVELAAGIVF